MKQLSKIFRTYSRTLTSLMLSIIMAASLAGCNGQIYAALFGDNTTSLLMLYQNMIESITIEALSPAGPDPSVPNGVDVQFQVILHLNSGKIKILTDPDELAKVIWSSDDPSIATITTLGVAEGVIDNYIFTPPLPTTTIHGTYKGFTADTSITIEDALLTDIIVTCADPDLSIADGTSTQFTATGVFSNGRNYNITADSNVDWASDSTDVSINTSTGLATAESPGGANISAKWNGSYDSAGGIKDNDSEFLTVSTAILTSITLSGPASAASGVDVDFTATGHFSDGTTQDMTDQFDWSSSNTSLADVDQNGHVTTSDTTTGTVTIYARYPEGGPYTITGSSSFDVTDAELVSIEVTAAGGKTSIAKGVTLNYTATGTYTNGTTPDITTLVTWDSSDTNIVTISNVSGTQGQAFGKAVGGPVTITASLSGKSDTASLSVTAAELVSLTVTPAAPSIGVRGTVTLKAEGHYTDGTVIDHTTVSAWSSEDYTKASVDQSGVVTGQTQTSPLSITITAQYGGQSATSEVTVTAATISRIEVTPVTATLTHVAPGNTLQYKATAVFSDTTTEDVTEAASWSSDNTGAATINNTPGTKGLATTAGAGSTTITATYSAVPGTATLTVNTVTLEYIVVTAAKSSIADGTMLQFTATGVYSNNTTQDLTTQALWSSSNETYVTISNAAGSKGVATGEAPGGPVTITAAFGGKSGTAPLTITNATLSSINITPTDPVAYIIAYGTTQQFTATGLFSDGTSQDLTMQVDWDSSDVTVANIDGTGLATTSTIEGYTTITAKYPKGCTTCVSESTTLRVISLTLQSIAVTPTDTTTWVGQTVQYFATGTFSDGSVTVTRDITDAVLWTTDSSGVATISNTLESRGLATAAGAGATTIRAKWGLTVEGSTGITVTATDTLSPTITDAQLLSGNRVKVTFSEAMDYTAAITTTAYKVVLDSSLTGACSDNSNFTGSGAGISVSSVTPLDQKTYILQLASGTIAAKYWLLGDKTVLKDASGNFLDCENSDWFMGNDTVAPYLVSVVNSTPTAITVTFSEKMTVDGGSTAADNPLSYTVAEDPSDGNAANNISISSITNVNDIVFILNLDKSAQSLQYKLTVSTAVTDQSSNLNPMGTPNWLTFQGNEQLKVVSAQSTGLKTIKIVFSKPVRSGLVGDFPYTSECSGVSDCNTKYKLFPRNSSDVSPLGDISSAVRGTGSESNTVTLTHANVQLGISYTAVVANAHDGDGFTNGTTRIESEASGSDYVQASPKDRATFLGSGDFIDKIDEGSVFDNPFGDGSIFTWSFVYGNKVYLGTNDNNNAAFRFDADGGNSVLTTFDIADGYTPTCSYADGFGYGTGTVCASTGNNQGFYGEKGVVGFNAGTITISATNYEILMVGPLKTGVMGGYGFFTQDLDTDLDWIPVTLSGTGGANTEAVQTTYAYGANMYMAASSEQGTQAPVVCRINFTGASGGALTVGASSDMALRSRSYIGKNAATYDNYKGTAEVVGIDVFYSFSNHLYAANNGGVVYSTDYNALTSPVRSHPNAFRPTDGDAVEPTPAEETLVLPLSGSGGLGKLSPGQHGVPRLLEYNGNLYMARNVASTGARHTSIRGELWKCVPSGGVCGPANWTRIISGSESDLPTGTNAISMLQNNGSGKLYVGFDNPNTGVGQGASVWMIDSTNPTPTGGTMSSVGWAQQGLPGLSNSHIKFYSSATINDGTYNYIYLTAGDDLNAIRVYRQRD